MTASLSIAPGVLFLVLAVLIVYTPALRGGFVWDDPEYVTQNPVIRTMEGGLRIWIEPGATPQYYPLVFTTFWIEYHLWGLKPFGFHLVNALLHALSAVLFWRLLKRLAVPGAFVAAALFALHPVHVESVAWITERKNVLSLVLYLSAAWVYLRFALSEVRLTAGRYVLACFLFILALLSKTVTCTLPAAMLLVLWWKKPRLALRDGLLLAPLFAAGIAFGLITALMEKYHVGAEGAEWSLPFLERCLLASRVPWFYAWKLVWPLDLVFIYPRWEIDAGIWWSYLFPAATLSVVAALWLLKAKWGKGSLVGVLFFLGSLFPAMGFFNVFPMRFSFVADHFQYLASLGLIALLTAAAVRTSRAFGTAGQYPVRVLCAVILAALAFLSWKQCHAYKDLETLWRDTLSRNPGAWIAHSNLGEILVEQGKIDEAEAHCRKALELKRDLPEAHGNLANALYHKGKYDEAALHLKEVLRLDPENLRAMNNLAAVYEAQGKWEDAVDLFNDALRIDPLYPSAHYNLANVLVKQGRIEEAAAHYSEALRVNPGFTQARGKLEELRRSMERK